MSVNRIEIEDNGTETRQPKNDLECQNSNKTTKQQGDALSSWHYISWIFGIILPLGTMSIITLSTSKNILIEPEYWYESVILIPTTTSSGPVGFLYILSVPDPSGNYLVYANLALTIIMYIKNTIL